jgi:hypothetical protein
MGARLPDMARPPAEDAMCEDNKIEADCCQDRAGLARRRRAELLGALRSCFVRAEPWLQVGKYAAALVSELPKRNGWTIAEVTFGLGSHPC